MKRAYIYPRTSKTSKDTTGVYNPYRDNFMESTSKFLYFVNKEDPSSTGIFHILKYIRNLDFLFLNWIEDLPDKKWGFMQSLFFLFLLRMKGVLKLQVVWTLHNKISHSGKNRITKKVLFKSLLKRSDLIITHAREGVDFAESINPGVKKKVFYFPHPIIPYGFEIDKTEKIYDFLIWGALSSYKGIDHFLQFLKESDLDKKYKLKIVGRAVSPDFFQKLASYKNDRISIEDVFVNHADLAKLIAGSHCVLFTYSGDSVLSSGVLIDSVAHRANVLGPHVGAFKEMADMGIIKTYNHFGEIPQILTGIKRENSEINKSKVSQFIKDHSWEKFAAALSQKLFY